MKPNHNDVDPQKEVGGVLRNGGEIRYEREERTGDKQHKNKKEEEGGRKERKPKVIEVVEVGLSMGVSCTTLPPNRVGLISGYVLPNFVD